MNEVNKTLFIPLFGKAQVSKKNMILHDKKAEEIWEREAFPIKGSAKSKWLTYFMAMRAKVFDDWADAMLLQNRNALVLHIGCGLDSRCTRVKERYTNWIDADFQEVISQRRQYFAETENYHMAIVNAAKTDDIEQLPDSAEVIVILEGISMYLTNEELKSMLHVLRKKYASVHLLMDVYTEIGARASKYKNPINEVGVTKVYGVGDIRQLTAGTKLKLKSEHSLTPSSLIHELTGFEKFVFRTIYAGKAAEKIYKLYELETV